MINFNLDKIYSFEDLPQQVKEDCAIQFSEFEEYSPEECLFKIEIISGERLLEEMDNIFGPNLIEELEGENVLELTEDIKLNGLINLPIGSEGIHRCLAFINLQKDLPRFRIIYPED